MLFTINNDNFTYLLYYFTFFFTFYNQIQAFPVYMYFYAYSLL